MEIDGRIAEAAILVGKANHYLVRIAPVPEADFDVWSSAAGIVIDRELAGEIDFAVADRALIAIAEASGYSLTDLGG